MTRWIELDGVVNMRDLGGLPTRDGRTTREGRLIPVSYTHLRAHET